MNNKRWLLLITRDMRLYMPPEIFRSRADCGFRGSTLALVLFGLHTSLGQETCWRPSEGGGSNVLHLVEMEMPESWGAMRLWACLATNEDMYPKLNAELIAATLTKGMPGCVNTPAT